MNSTINSFEIENSIEINISREFTYERLIFVGEKTSPRVSGESCRKAKFMTLLWVLKIEFYFNDWNLGAPVN